MGQGDAQGDFQARGDAPVEPQISGGQFIAAKQRITREDVRQVAATLTVGHEERQAGVSADGRIEQPRLDVGVIALLKAVIEHSVPAARRSRPLYSEHPVEGRVAISRACRAALDLDRGHVEQINDSGQVGVEHDPIDPQAHRRNLATRRRGVAKAAKRHRQGARPRAGPLDRQARRQAIQALERHYGALLREGLRRDQGPGPRPEVRVRDALTGCGDRPVRWRSVGRALLLLGQRCAERAGRSPSAL